MIIDQNESYIYNTETPTYYDLNPGDVFYFINDKSKTVYMKLDKLCHWYQLILLPVKLLSLMIKQGNQFIFMMVLFLK